MSAELFVTCLGVLLAVILGAGFRVLPQERWQVIASIPTHKDAEGRWVGRNLTFYGLLSALAEVFGAVMVLLLAGAAGVPRADTLAVMTVLLVVGLTASKAVARWIEGKRHTFTVGGAVFVGIVLAPAIVLGVQHVAALVGGRPFPPQALLAALAIGYVYGEGLGRLACVSFGCCYGKPLYRLGPVWREALERLSFTFHGETKKIAYEIGWHGIKVVPIQAMTSVALTACALLSTWLFLSGHFAAAFVLAVAFSQGWRAVSETLRGDHRGGGEKVSAYQVMAVAGGLYALAVAPLFPAGPPVTPSLSAGLTSVWDPLILVALQLVGLLVFLVTGCSKVTGCSLSFHVRRHEI
jgi:hypothetical protein